MSGSDALQSVQFVTANSKRFAVLDADDWDTLIEWLETIEDIQIVRKSSADLQTAGGDRQKAGWKMKRIGIDEL